jgi:putative tryptophan/tyrosine transport system substrate-binding protein
VTPAASVSVHRDLIIGLAAKHKLPAVYPYRYLAAGGGLMSYAPDTVNEFRRGAAYVDRILKGEKPVCHYLSALQATGTAVGIVTGFGR